VLQLKLQLALKDNEISRVEKKALELKKELEKEQRHSLELVRLIDSLKNSISSLERDIVTMHGVNNEQKVAHTYCRICLIASINKPTPILLPNISH